MQARGTAFVSKTHLPLDGLIEVVEVGDRDGLPYSLAVEVRLDLLAGLRRGPGGDEVEGHRVPHLTELARHIHYLGMGKEFGRCQSSVEGGDVKRLSSTPTS